MMPWMSGSRFSRRRVASSSPSVTYGGQIDLLGSDADVGARLVLRAHVDARGLVVAHQDGRQARV